MRTCRSKDNATKKDLRHAAALLIAAAGVKLPVPMNVTAMASNNSLEQPDKQYSSGIQFAEQSNTEALKELARAYEAGKACHFVPADTMLITAASAPYWMFQWQTGQFADARPARCNRAPTLLKDIDCSLSSLIFPGYVAFQAGSPSKVQEHWHIQPA